MSDKLISVTDGGVNVVYQTDDMGDLDLDQISNDGGRLNTDEKKKAAANARVAFEADRYITVNLGSEWSGSRSDADRALVIILSDVTVPIPSRLTETDAANSAHTDYANDYANIPFTCSSSGRNGTLSRLSGSVEVKVGNILGDRDLAATNNRGQLTDDETRDPLIREFKVTPGRVFPGDKNIPVTITFEAPGPMYGSTLTITIPIGFRPTNPSASTIRVSGGGVPLLIGIPLITLSPLLFPLIQSIGVRELPFPIA